MSTSKGDGLVPNSQHVDDEEGSPAQEVAQHHRQRQLDRFHLRLGHPALVPSGLALTGRQATQRLCILTTHVAVGVAGLEPQGGGVVVSRAGAGGGPVRENKKSNFGCLFQSLIIERVGDVEADRKKCWKDNVKERTSLFILELLTMASHKGGRGA